MLILKNRHQCFKIVSKTFRLQKVTNIIHQNRCRYHFWLWIIIYNPKRDLPFWMRPFWMRPFWLNRYWWLMLETKFVGDNYNISVTVLAISVTNIQFLFTQVPSVKNVTNIHKSLSHQHHCHSILANRTAYINYFELTDVNEGRWGSKFWSPVFLVS